MAGFRLKYAAVTGQFAKALEAKQLPIATAATGAIRDAGDYIKLNGRANIAAAGFSKRWQNALRVNLYPSRGVSLHPAAQAFHKIPYAGVFETGATIAGSPLLWLPLPDMPVSAFGRHMSPENYVRLIGPLKSVFRPGKPPLLLGQMVGGSQTAKITIAKLVAGARAGKRVLPGAPSKVVWIPLFYGLDAVQLQKRFDLYPIFDRAKDLLGEFYLRNLKV